MKSLKKKTENSKLTPTTIRDGTDDHCFNDVYHSREKWIRKLDTTNNLFSLLFYHKLCIFYCNVLPYCQRTHTHTHLQNMWSPPREKLSMVDFTFAVLKFILYHWQPRKYCRVYQGVPCRTKFRRTTLPKKMNRITEKKKIFEL